MTTHVLLVSVHKVLILPNPEPFVEAAVGRSEVYVTCAFPGQLRSPTGVTVLAGRLVIRFSRRRGDVLRVNVPVPIRATPISVSTRNGVTDIRLRRRPGKSK